MSRYAWLQMRDGHTSSCRCFACFVGSPDHPALSVVEQPSIAFVQRIARHGAYLRRAVSVGEHVSPAFRRVQLDCDHTVNAATLPDGTILKRYYLCPCCFDQAVGA